MRVELISVIILTLMFVIATWRDVNMGVLGLVAASVLGTFFLGLGIGDVWNGFPVDIFVTLVGLTYLFGFAQDNGAIEVLVRWSMRLVRGNVALAPWIFFTITLVVISFGALFAVGIVTPLALGFARRHRINQLMVGVLVVHGALAGAFSPISVYGVFINGFLAQQGFEPAPLSLFVAPLLFNVIFAAVAYLALRNRPDAEMLRSSNEPVDAVLPASGPGTGAAGQRRLTVYQTATLVALGLMVVLVIGFSLNIGVVSMALAATLAIVRPSAGVTALGRVSWSVVLLIAGVLTYIAVLQRAGTVEWVSSGISAVSIPLLAALLLFYLSGFVSALASSLGVIGVVIALAVPFLQSGDVHLAGFVAGLGIAATIVDISPFSTNGAMLLANVSTDIRDWFYRRMLVYAGLMCLLGPGMAWFVAAVPTWIG